jgi:hypothetical protein
VSHKLSFLLLEIRSEATSNCTVIPHLDSLSNTISAMRTCLKVRKHRSDDDDDDDDGDDDDHDHDHYIKLPHHDNNYRWLPVA